MGLLAKTMKRKTSRGKRKSSFDKKIKKVIYLVLALYVFQVIGKGMFGTYSFTIYGVAQTDAAEEEKIVSDPCGLEVVVCEGEKSKPFTIEEKIRAKFPEQPDEMLATLKAESGLNPKAMGWNCYYSRETGEVLTLDEAMKLSKDKRYSTACRTEHRHMAWSVDCGVAQHNVMGQVCPEELYDVDYSLDLAREKYEKRGLDPWFAWKNKSYLKFL
jgi:nitrate reductase NapE component